MGETPSAGTPQGVSKDAPLMAMLAHLLSIVIGFLGPLIIWLAKKDDPFVEDQAKEALNFQLTLLIGCVIGFVLAFFCVGTLILAALWILNIIFSVLAAIKANEGVKYRYPVAIRFIK